ncbi:MAG: pyruvate kinase [Oligoflexia bacterium]|nr:pyruvate kinase [Oligoflexia bacterium]
MLPSNNTKIIATLGPASNSMEKIKELVQAGADIFRLNFSHSSHDNALTLIKIIREIENSLNKPLPIIQDLQGPKIRLNSFDIKLCDTTLTEESSFIINMPDNTEDGPDDVIYIKYKNIEKELSPGDRILIDDGNIELSVTEISGKKIISKVIRGGELRPRKGVNLPDTRLSIPALTEKDITDAEFGIKNNVDYIALSFVRSPADIIELKKIIDKFSSKTGIIAKIEKPEALENIEKIFDLCDAILVARGDLGVECALEKVPSLQKRLIELGKSKKVPVIIATQMLESMIKNSSPTRAEVTDVYQAVRDGADIVMLSAETSVGEHPAESISMMERIINIAEKDTQGIKYCMDFFGDTESAVAFAGATITEQIAANFICVFTETGKTARTVSKTGMKHPVIAFTNSKKTWRKISLFRGVTPFLTGNIDNIDLLFEITGEELLKKGLCQRGDKVVIVAGQPLGRAGSTNLLKVHTISR